VSLPFSKLGAELTEQPAEPSIAPKQPHGAEFLVPLAPSQFQLIQPHLIVVYHTLPHFNVTLPIEYLGIEPRQRNVPLLKLLFILFYFTLFYHVIRLVGLSADWDWDWNWTIEIVEKMHP
jgi:hypothetical protein